LNLKRSYPAAAPVVCFVLMGTARGRVLKRGTKVTTIPIKAPHGHLCNMADRSILRVIQPVAAGK